jgi:DNA-binding PadR family transcriptional regulator
MDRWPDLDINQNRKTVSEQPNQEVRERPPALGNTAGRGRTTSAEAHTRIIPQSLPVAPERTTKRRTRHNALDRSHSLRSSEIRAMCDIGKFRTVDIKDLARFAYQNSDTRMAQGIRRLRSQGLIQERTIYRAHRQPRRILTLTEQGQRLLRKGSHVPDEQRLYYGFLRLKETDHDTDLYKVYQKEAEEIQKEGGRLTKVRLDFELKGAVNRARDAAGKLPEGQRQAWLKAVTGQLGLSIKGGAIQLPDMQIEYETAEGTLAQANIELVTENYRGDAIRSKAAAGFKVYARVEDSSRVNRALENSGAVEEILSI